MKPIISILIAFALSASPSFSQSNNWVWAQAWVGSTDAHANATDANGNVFACGYATAAPTFGSITLPYPGFFVVKLNSSGTVVAASGPSANTLGGDAYGICTDATGNVYVTGYFHDSLQLGSNVLMDTAGSETLFIAKYDNNLNLIWCQRSSALVHNAAVNGRSVCVAPNGDLYLAGAFQDSVAFGSTIVTSTVSNGFISKLSPSTGAFTWTKVVSSNNICDVNLLIADPFSNIYVTGGFYGFVNMGTLSLSSGSSSQGFVSKLTPNGDFIWARLVRGGVVSLAGSQNNLLLVGGYPGPNLTVGSMSLSFPDTTYYLAKLDTGGNYQWLKISGITGSVVARDIAIDTLNNLYVCGHQTSTLTVGQANVPFAGHIDIFIAKYFANGDVIWAQTAGAYHADFCQSISTDPSGGVYVSGTFADTSMFGSIALSSIWQSAFTAKLNSTLSVAETRISPALSIYPNPASDVLHISSTEDIVACKIMDIAGRVVVFSKKEKAIDISHLSNGIYCVEICTGNGSYREKLSVVK